MSDKIVITLEGLKVLAHAARANGTEDSFMALALQWAESAAIEVGALQSELARVTAERDDAEARAEKWQDECEYAQARAERAEAENVEQARLLGMSGEREARLLAELAEARKDAPDAKRYRFLAGADIPQHSKRWQRWKLEYWSGYHGGWQPLTGVELDAAIDEAKGDA